ncbi:MAG: toprim domain-containing protein, partial [Chloroflexota bacterium]|nr:toprim domain-containing protein [Chloroflexota bacterium]
MLGYAPESWDATLRFLRSREHAPEQISAAGLVVERAGGGYYDRFRDRIMFPIRDRDGAVIGFGGRTLGDGQPKYMNSPESPLFTKGSHLYGLDLAQDAIRTQKQVVIVEGYVDAVIAHAGGFRNVVATLGTALTPAHVRLLSRLTTDVVLALDADAAGDTAAMRGWEVLRDSVRRRSIPIKSRGRVIASQKDMELSVRIARLPRGEDPDTLIRKAPDQWVSLISEARTVVEHFFATVRETMDLRSPEGRSRAVAELAPIVGDLGNPIERAHYVGQLALMAGITENEAAAQVARSKQQVRGPRREQTGFTPMRSVSPEELTLVLLLRYPRLLGELPPGLCDDLEEIQHKELFEKMIQIGPEALTPEKLIDTVEEPLKAYVTDLLRLVELQPELLSNEQPVELRRRLDLIRRRRLRELINQHSVLLKEAMEMGDQAGVMALLANVPALATEVREFDPPQSPYFKDSRQ